MRLIVGDCVEVMAGLDAESVDAIVTDPPYGLEFMGKEWDKLAIGRAASYSEGGKLHDPELRRGKGGAGPQYVQRPAKRCAFCGKQAWSGSPCECDDPRWVLDNSPLHTAQLWHQRWAEQALRVLKPGGHLLAFGGSRTYHRMASAVEDAGFEIRDQLMWLYGSGFPKSHNVAAAIDKANGVIGHRGAAFSYAGETEGGQDFKGNPAGGLPGYSNPDNPWDGWGTALKPAHEPIVLARKPLIGTVAANVQEFGTGGLNIDACRIEVASGDEPDEVGGRWPANVLLDDEAAALLDEQSGMSQSPQTVTSGESGNSRTMAGGIKGRQEGVAAPGDFGGASRFFYCAKASSGERNAGLDDDRNIHPTVKPIDLMRYLIRLITPPGGTVLDPFLGSGTTGIAAHLEARDFIGIELSDEYMLIAEARIDHWTRQGVLPL